MDSFAGSAVKLTALEAGDLVEVVNERIGVLANRVVRDGSDPSA